jgi:hypothetical protein
VHDVESILARVRDAPGVARASDPGGSFSLTRVYYPRGTLYKDKVVATRKHYG